jgi:hypothetical protein
MGNNGDLSLVVWCVVCTELVQVDAGGLMKREWQGKREGGAIEDLSIQWKILNNKVLLVSSNSKC